MPEAVPDELIRQITWVPSAGSGSVTFGFSGASGLQNVPWDGTVVHAETVLMIASFRDEWLRAFFIEDARSKRIPPDLEGRLFRKLQMIDDATSDQDLRVPPSNHFEKLRGHLAGWYSIRVNGQWRLVFKWNGGHGEAQDVHLDNHDYQ